MPPINGDRSREWPPLPDGKHLCSVAKIEETTSRNGDSKWKLRFAVIEEPHWGRYIFDTVTFSERAMPRVHILCEALGLNPKKINDLTPEMCMGRECVVEVYTATYTDGNGNEQQTNRVPFVGFFQIPKAAPPRADQDISDAPF